MRTVPDQRARDDIATDLGRTLFVEAGAGTGKTSSLVARVVELLRSGVGVDQLAVITFTEAAAAELRDRIRSTLEAIDDSWALDALGGLDAAAISTLHGFAQRILAENPLEAGLPPVIEVHSEIGAQVEFERRWRGVLDRLLEESLTEEVVQRAVVCGIELRHLKALARLLDDEWDRIPPAEEPLDGALAPVSLSAVLEPLAAALALADHCRDPDDLMLGHLRRLQPWLERARAAPDDLDRLRVLAGVHRLGSGYGRKGNWPDGCLAEVKDHLDTAQQARDDLLSARVSEVLGRLLAVLGRATLAGVAARRAAGHLHFHDLLVMCRDLLRSSPAVRRRLHERYAHLLIDEFQDTDPIQIEIARLIASRVDDVVGRHWSEIEAEPGRLFFVGDAKQAIYRFRRADIGLFLAVRDDGASHERVLSTNFRSVPGIVEWVNRSFAEIMGEGVSGAQPAYQPLVAHRADAHGGERPVVLLGGPREERTAAERRTAMGDDLASTLRSVVHQSWPVVDRRTGEWRPARWGDIAVLIPARTGLPQLRAAFDRAAVPYRIEASSLVWLTQEVRDLLSVLRAVDDPTDELALVAALRSPGFGCADDDLARFVGAGGRLDLSRPIPEGVPTEDPVASGIASLRALHDAATWDEPSTLVERVVRERHLMELATASSRPRDIWRRLRFVADQARAYADAEGGTLRDFLDWTDLQADESARVTESVLPETDDDAVRVMTVHASKGLEFPVVAVAGLDRQPNEQRPGPRLLWGDDGRIEAHLRKGLATLGSEPLGRVDDAHEVHEAWRLMYVATTRARDHLIMCLHHKAGVAPEKNLAARLFEIAERHPDTWRRPDDQLTLQLGAPEPADSASSIPSPPGREEWRRRRAELLLEASRPSVVAATAVAHLDPDEPVATEDEPWRRGRAGTSIGRAVHATLQLLDLASGEGLGEIASAQAAAEGIPGRAREVEASARAALSAPSVQAAASARHWRELYVGASIDGVLCEGYLDVLVEHPEGYEIIDYKTDRAPDPTALVDRYRLQAATYALLVESTLGRPVRRCVLVVLGEDGATEVPIDDLAAATAEVRRRLRDEARPLGTRGGAEGSVAGAVAG